MKLLTVVLFLIAPALYAQSVLSEKDVALLIQPKENYSGTAVAAMWQWQIRKDNAAIAERDRYNELMLANADLRIAYQNQLYRHDVAALIILAVMGMTTVWSLSRRC